LLLGLLREELCFAAKLLKERGIVLEQVRSDLALNPHETPFRDPVRVTAGSFHGVVQPSYLVSIKPGHPLVGREAELERLLESPRAPPYQQSGVSWGTRRGPAGNCPRPRAAHRAMTRFLFSLPTQRSWNSICRRPRAVKNSRIFAKHC